ncbi:hypothetical protein K466DRAFT_445918, partial [Polyporus arcularius HHB13444]
RRTFPTFPLGPQLQALWASPDHARLMRHRVEEMKRFEREHARNPQTAGKVLDDIYYSREYQDLVKRKELKDDDMLLMFSVDGAQLFSKKQSDCWFFVWVLFDLSPDRRYKKRYVLP